MKRPPVVRLQCATRLLASAMLLMPLFACSSHSANQAIAAVPVIAVAALTGGLDDQGEFVAYLPEGNKLEGRWGSVTKPDSAATVAIQTPHGQVSIVDLVRPDLPAFYGKVEGPPMAMICSFAGDESSGYRFRCADQWGIEWVGSLGNYQNPFNLFSDSLVVALREAPDCRTCDLEDDHDAGSR